MQQLSFMPPVVYMKQRFTLVSRNSFVAWCFLYYSYAIVAVTLNFVNKHEKVLCKKIEHLECQEDFPECVNYAIIGNATLGWKVSERLSNSVFFLTTENSLRF